MSATTGEGPENLAFNLLLVCKDLSSLLTGLFPNLGVSRFTSVFVSDIYWTIPGIVRHEDSLFLAVYWFHWFTRVVVTLVMEWFIN